MTDRPLPVDPLFTPQEAATKLKMSIKTLMSHIRAGRLRFIDIGNGGVRKRHRFTTYNLQTFIENQKVRETPKCQSIVAPTKKNTATTFTSGVVAFTALLKPGTGKTPKPQSTN
jgi:hypothetical protein